MKVKSAPWFGLWWEFDKSLVALTSFGNLIVTAQLNTTPVGIDKVISPTKCCSFSRFSVHHPLKLLRHFLRCSLQTPWHPVGRMSVNVTAWYILRNWSEAVRTDKEKLDIIWCRHSFYLLRRWLLLSPLEYRGKGCGEIFLDFFVVENMHFFFSRTIWDVWIPYNSC